MIATGSTVAQTIKDQIGFWAIAEVGARTFLFDADSLYFDAKPKRNIVRVVVTLDPSDTYTVKVLNKRTGAELYKAEMIYNDQLAEIIRNLAKEI